MPDLIRRGCSSRKLKREVKQLVARAGESARYANQAEGQADG